MLFWKKKTPPLVQSSASAWREQWRAIVPPECRNVPVTVGDKTVTAYVQINHFVMMLQDGLLMEEHFFDVCSHFQRAGYHVIWLMRCTQDIENGYLKLKKQRGDKCLWKWRKPTTNFGRWTSDNRCVTILLQYKPAPDGRSSTARSTFCSASSGRRARTTRRWSLAHGICHRRHPRHPRRARQLASRRLHVRRFVKFSVGCRPSSNNSFHA